MLHFVLSSRRHFATNLIARERFQAVLGERLHAFSRLRPVRDEGDVENGASIEIAVGDKRTLYPRNVTGAALAKRMRSCMQSHAHFAGH